MMGLEIKSRGRTSVAASPCHPSALPLLSSHTAIHGRDGARLRGVVKRKWLPGNRRKRHSRSCRLLTSAQIDVGGIWANIHGADGKIRPRFCLCLQKTERWGRGCGGKD